jgi:hypothetical protein
MFRQPKTQLLLKKREEALAFLRAWSEQLDMREVGGVVDRLVAVYHGVAPESRLLHAGAGL